MHSAVQCSAGAAARRIYRRRRCTCMEGEEKTEEMQQFAIALGAIEVRERKS